MFNITSFSNTEFIIFIIIESVLVIGYIVFSRYSRNHGGAFDRRIDDRRGMPRRGALHSFDRRVLDIGFGNVRVELAGTDEIYQVDTNRRLGDRRSVPDRRRKIII